MPSIQTAPPRSMLTKWPTCLGLFAKAKEFVEKVYLPDVLAVAPFYLEWAGLGEGLGNFMSYGDFPLTDTKSSNEPGELFIPRGMILNRDLSKVLPARPEDDHRICDPLLVQLRR